MRDLIATLGLIGCIWLFAASGGNAQSAPQDDPWPALAADVFDGKPLRESDGLITLEAPYRAEDAAVVPLTIRTNLPASDSRHVSRITLVIDQNPSPVAAEFSFGPEARVNELTTRVRVDTYTNIHVVAELSDGSLHVTERFVKASGGCSAPAAKNPDEALASLGKMKLRQFPVAAGTPDTREVQLMIRHPNNSGLQMDQLTRNYIPLHIIRDLKISQGDQLVMRVEGGISISEDPNFRFTFRAGGKGALAVEAVDTEEKVFRGEWPLQDDPSGS